MGVLARAGPQLNVRNMTAFSKPQIEIVLDAAHGKSDAYITSFSTLDSIKGVVRITTRNDTRFDEIEIAMLGVTKTYIDKLASATAMGGRQESMHRFLKLTQPIRQDEYPQPRVWEANKVYEYPFHFAVPEQLLPKACQHKLQNPALKDAHLQPPPSFGDPALSGHGSTLLDDLAPMMAKVLYFIRVEVYRDHPNDGSQIILAEGSKKLRVKPAVDEQPPLDLDIYGKHEDYCLRQEKSLRKGMLKGKLGRMVMETTQPSAFKLPAMIPGEPFSPVTTKVRVALRFDPTDESTQPPKLSSLSSKLKVATFFSCTPRINFPSRLSLVYDGSQGYISEFLNLSTMSVGSVEWQKHESWESPVSRRASAVSQDSDVSVIRSNSSGPSAILEPSADYKGKSFYTATILVPLSLPMKKNIVPSFHTCLVSRVYGLHVSLGLSGQPLGSSITLKLPVQVASEGSIGSVERRRQSSFMQQAQIDADAAFEPRNIGPPPDVFLNQSQLDGAPSANNEPPSYTALDVAPSMRSASVSVAG